MIDIRTVSYTHLIQQSVLNPQVALAFAALNLADELVNLQQKLRPDGEPGDFVKRKRVYRRVKK